MNVVGRNDPNFRDDGRREVTGRDTDAFKFRTLTLRQLKDGRFFFHNGRFTTLEDVMHFYVERDSDPQRWYPVIGSRVMKFDDLPARYRENVDISDAPLNRERDQQPVLNEEEIRQVIALLDTLSDSD